MTPQAKVDFLKTVSLFDDMSESELRAVSESFKDEHFKKKNFIFFENDKASRFYLIYSGAVKITKIDHSGAEVVLAIISSGEFFGEMAIVDDYLRNANAVVINDTILLSMEGKDFLELLKNSSTFSFNLIKNFCQRIRISDYAIKNLFLDDVERRILFNLYQFGKQHGVRKNSNLILPKLPNQSDFANLVGSSRETLSRNLRKFEQAGLISRDDKKITILDYESFLTRFNFDGDL